MGCVLAPTEEATTRLTMGQLREIGNLWQRDAPTFEAIRQFIAEPAAAGKGSR
jgi:hypothetical protein